VSRPEPNSRRVDREREQLPRRRHPNRWRAHLRVVVDNIIYPVSTKPRAARYRFACLTSAERGEDGAALIEELKRVSVKGVDKIYLRRAGDSHCDIASALALAAFELRFSTGVPEGKPVGGLSLSRRFDEAQQGRANGWTGDEGRSIFHQRF
jgi:hypothetical protein